MKNYLHGNHPKIIPFLKALGIPIDNKSIKSFIIKGAVDDLIKADIEYIVEENDIDIEALEKLDVQLNIKMHEIEADKLDGEPLAEKDWPQTIIS